jgi:hypothetical protein
MDRWWTTMRWTALDRTSLQPDRQSLLDAAVTVSRLITHNTVPMVRQLQTNGTLYKRQPIYYENKWKFVIVNYSHRDIRPGLKKNALLFSFKLVYFGLVRGHTAKETLSNPDARRDEKHFMCTYFQSVLNKLNFFENFSRTGNGVETKREPIIHEICALKQGCTNHVHQAALANRFCTVSTNICGSSV